MRRSKSTYNLLASLLYKIGTCVLGLLIPRLFVMSYGSELNGLQSSVSQIFGYIALIEAGVGEATLQSLFGPVAKGDRKTANQVLSATTFYYNKIGCIYFLILLALAAVYPLLVAVGSVSYWTVVLYILFSGLTTGLNFFYQSKIILVMQAEGDLYINSLVTMFAYFMTSIVKIACILGGMNIVVIQVGYFAVNLLGTLTYYCVAKRKYPWINFRETPDMKAIEQKNAALIHKVSGIVFQNTDIIILTVVCGLKVVSIYTMYKLVINMVTTIVASFSDSYNHVLGQTYNGGNNGGYAGLIDTFNVLYSTIAFALFTVTNILILPFLRLYTAGMDINYIFPVLPYLYIAIEVLQIGREAMLRTITVAGHFRKTLYASITEMVINLVVSIVAVFVCKKLWGETAGLYGVLMGTIAALLYRTIETNRYANKIILKRGAFKTNKIMVTNLMLFGVVEFFLKKVVPPIKTYLSFVGWGAVLTISVTSFYLLVQCALNPHECKIILNRIHPRIKKGEK